MRRQIFIALLLAGSTLAVYWPAGSYDVVFYDDTFFTAAPEVLGGLNGQSMIWALTGVVAANWHPVTTLSFVLTHQFFGTNPGAEHLVNAVIHALNAGLLFLVLVGMTTGREESGKRKAESGNSPDDGRGEKLKLGKQKTEESGKRKTFNIQHSTSNIQHSTSNIQHSTSNIQQSSSPTTPGATRAAAGSATEAWPPLMWRCAVVAAVFAWHPLRVESVAWIAERKDVLCGFFLLLTLLCYALRVTGGGWQVAGGRQAPARATRHASLFYWLAVLFFALSLLSKAMAVTLPFLLLLLDVWPLRREQKAESRKQKWQRLVVEKWPFFALTAVFCVVTFLVQRAADATPSLQQLGPGLRAGNIIVSYLRYLGWTVWPANLAMFYSFPYDRHFYLALWPDWQIAAGALLLAGVSALCLRQLNRRPYLAVGWFWYLGMMVPVIGFVQVGSQGMADRYTYLPLIGPVISVVWLVAERGLTGIFSKALLTGLVTVILAAGLFQTRHQLQFWKNTETLCKHTIEVTGENSQAEYIAGLGSEHEGRVAEAMAHYRNAVSSQPRVREAFYALARLLGQQGNWTMAEQTYATMLGDDPNDFTAHLGLATTLPHLGRNAEAAAHLKTAVDHCPDTPDALNNLAWTLATSGTAEFRDGPRAVALAERACTLTGYRETVMVGTLGAAYAEAGRFEDALATAQKACALASALGQDDLLKINQHLLESYRQHQPYREMANPEPPDPTATNHPPDALPH